MRLNETSKFGANFPESRQANNLIIKQIQFSQRLSAIQTLVYVLIWKFILYSSGYKMKVLNLLRTRFYFKNQLIYFHIGIKNLINNCKICEHLILYAILWIIYNPVIENLIKDNVLNNTFIGKHYLSPPL